MFVKYYFQVSFNLTVILSMFKITQNTATVLHKGINRFLSKTGSGSPLKLAKCLRISVSAFLQIKTKETSHFLFPLDCSSFSS